MCGVTGFFDFKARFSRGDSVRILSAMSREIAHRGPDSSGSWADEQSGIGLAHQRLAIVDLSSAGEQPMHSASGRFVIVYNGEVYNAPELASQLGGALKGHSDTEVVLEACEKWGVEQACRRFIGMFAFVLWDKQNRELFLARDRLGKKPLYWGQVNDTLFFGSQLRSFTKHPLWKGTVNQEAVKAYLGVNYIQAPSTIYERFYQLQPGSILRIDSNKKIQESVYWSLAELPSIQIENPQEELHALLRDSVKRRLMADVELGAFLSGGVDSATIVALMQEVSSKRVKTFSIGSERHEYDESKQAKAIAQHLNTEHYGFVATDLEARELIPQLPEYYDEPFGDASQIPTFLVSRFASQHVKVALSGDGGDELFGGYNRYLIAHRYWPYAQKTPMLLRQLGAWILRQMPVGRLGERAYKFGHWLSAHDGQEFYMRSISQWPSLKPVQISGVIWEGDMLKTMQLADLKTYLPGDILTKLDRASMAVGLEARTPYLDHRLVEWAMNLSLEQKIKNNQTKWILRQILKKYVPLELLSKQKMGFGVPIDSWLRGPLRDWAEELLNPEHLEEIKLPVKMIRNTWQEHLAQRGNWQYPIWGVLMLVAWKQRWVN